MKQSIKTIEQKITSVHKISKITKAMKLIATIRFQAAFKQIVNTDTFLNVISQTFSQLKCLLDYEQLNQSPTLTTKTENKLWLVFASDLGLCGSYNHSLFQKIDNQRKKDDLLIAVGKKMISYFQHLNVPLAKQYDATDFVEQNLSPLVEWLIKHFQVLFSEIVVVYTHFVSAGVQNIVFKRLLPVEIQTGLQTKQVIADFLIEPSAYTVYRSTLPVYLQSLLLFHYWNARASEEKIRQIAMESASENAHDMLKELKLQYNQLRQEKITKEIILVSQDS